ncbi:hypothetical protein R1sor_016809 [Riccia sorocarpa]|uniref:Aminotransferase-like plant mobile domain-containing protein n=1 Tax=Riccia sorocarpa TaxID=122646 RepID=A0ABD3HK72_9MARC
MAGKNVIESLRRIEFFEEDAILPREARPAWWDLMVMSTKFIPYPGPKPDALDDLTYWTLEHYSILPYFIQLQASALPTTLFYRLIATCYFSTDKSEYLILRVNAPGHQLIVTPTVIRTSFDIPEDQVAGQREIGGRRYTGVLKLQQVLDRGLADFVEISRNKNKFLVYRQVKPKGPATVPLQIISDYLVCRGDKRRVAVQALAAFMECLHGGRFDWGHLLAVSLAAVVKDFKRGFERTVVGNRSITWAPALMCIAHTYRAQLFVPPIGCKEVWKEYEKHHGSIDIMESLRMEFPESEMVDEDDLPERLKLTGENSKKPAGGQKDPPASQSAPRKSARGRKVILQLSDTESDGSPTQPAKKKSKPDTGGRKGGNFDEDVRQQYQVRTRQLADVINRPASVPTPQYNPDQDDMDAEPIPVDPSIDPTPIDLNTGPEDVEETREATPDPTLTTTSLAAAIQKTMAAVAKGKRPVTGASPTRKSGTMGPPAAQKLMFGEFDKRFPDAVEGRGAALNTLASVAATGAAAGPSRTLLDRIAELSQPEQATRTTEEMQAANEVLNEPGIPYQPAGQVSDLSLIDYTTQIVEMVKDWTHERQKVKEPASVRPSILMMVRYFLSQLPQIPGVTVEGPAATEQVPEFQALCAMMASWAGDLKRERELEHPLWEARRKQAEQLDSELRSLKEKYGIPVMDLHPTPTPTQLIDAMEERLEKDLAEARLAEQKWKEQAERDIADRVRLREEHGLMLVNPENPTLELLMQRMAEREQDIESHRKTAEIKAADLQDQLDSARSVQTGVEAKAAERERWERNAARLADFMKQCDELRKALREKDVQVEELQKRWWETPIGDSTPVHNEWTQAKEELRGFEQRLIDLDSPEMSIGSGGHPIMDPAMIRSARESLETEWDLRVQIQNDRATPVLTTMEEAGPSQPVETGLTTPPTGLAQPSLESGRSPSPIKPVATAEIMSEAE